MCREWFCIPYLSGFHTDFEFFRSLFSPAPWLHDALNSDFRSRSVPPQKGTALPIQFRFSSDHGLDAGLETANRIWSNS